MIITKSPLRIGFAGGGSDIPSFCKDYKGVCINATIDKYVYVLVKRRPDDKIYLKYSENEIVDSVDDIKHDFIRETLKYLSIDFGIEIINWADIPTKGTGLGSSSSFLVGLLNALHTLMGKQVSAKQLAIEACEIEINKCNKPIGFQDQFAAAFGGLNMMQFSVEPERTFIEKIDFTDSELLELSNNLMMFYTGLTRESANILQVQSVNLENDEDILARMIANVDIAEGLYVSLKNRHLGHTGTAMAKNWTLKKSFNKDISNAFIDGMHDIAINNGAMGGKITGAGGGGFLVVYAPISCRDRIEAKLTSFASGIKFMPAKIDKYGSRVLLNTEEHVW
ncbi:MAG: GHMP kinase [SAR202 cluster bacterium]|nr:GHMP kinase [SAR202 cluster bacterium]